jgi:membrane protein
MTMRNGLWRRGTDPLATLVQTLRSWPWFDTARTLRRRFREDRLGISASSLTFTTLIALVPLMTVMLALFSAFPMFAKFQGALQQYFLQSLVPDGIAKPVLDALTQFAAKANRLGSAGLVVLVFTALALMLTIDRTLNAIWRVRKPRPIAQRVLVYWAAITLGPLLLGISLSLGSIALSSSRGLIAALPGGLTLLLDALEFALLALAMSGLFRYVPNTDVRWPHALAGGLFVAVGFEAAKRVLTWYLKAMPGVSVVYGAFATVPILLLWIYLSWLIVLFGAVIAAYAPSLQMHLARHGDEPGQRFALALALLRELHRAAARPDDRAVRCRGAHRPVAGGAADGAAAAPGLGGPRRRGRDQAPRAALRRRGHPRRTADRPAAAGPRPAHAVLSPAFGTGQADAGRSHRRLKPGPAGQAACVMPSCDSC